MSNTIQNINNIGPMKDSGASAAETHDPVKKDYEEGKRFLENGNLSQAAVALHNSLLGFEEKDDKPGIANASNQLGHVCFEKGDYVGAMSHYERALDLCKEFGDPMSIFALTSRFVDVHAKMKDFEKAISLSLDLLDTHHKNNDPRGTVQVLEKMAEIYVEAEKPGKAADTYRTIASIHKNFKHQSIAESFEEKAKELEKGA